MNLVDASMNEGVIRQAEAEIVQEQFRAAVDQYKEKLRRRRGFWDRLFPWRLIIVRKDHALRRQKGERGS